MNMTSKFGFSIAALMAFVPATLMATLPSPSYRDFALSDAEVNEVIRSIDAQCPQISDDYSSTMAREPLYQAECRSKQTVRNEALLKDAYKRTLASLSKPAKNALRTEQRDWVRTRFEVCEHDRNENLGGARKNVLFYDCQIFELKRRTVWIERLL
jgi:uncharacterized protein YecT (DUF1311 family)